MRNIIIIVIVNYRKISVMEKKFVQSEREINL